MRFSNKRTWASVLILILIEQTIKIVINNRHIDKNIAILPPVLYFKPVFNIDYSWFNSMLQLGLSRWLHIAVVGIVITLVLLFYQYLSYIKKTNRTVNIMFAFIFSGAMCSLIDKVFWNGSLDYIQVRGFFTFDLKDVYINISIGVLILLMFAKNNVFDQMNDKNLIRSFTKYIMRRL